jgi:hypothetical protein
MLRLHLPPEISCGRLVLRIHGRGQPLLRDLRILNLRVMGMEWEPAPGWLRAACPVSRETAEPEIQVLSTGERQIQFAVRPGAGAALKSFDLNIRDAAGNLVFEAANQAGGGEHLITLNLNFGLSGGTPPQSSWRLEMVRTKQPQDWADSYHAPHPLASRIPRAAYLHIHACGDFTLLARQNWFALRSYAEFAIWPMHIDALFCYAAFHAGIREVILRDPLRVYHIEHLSAAGWTPEGEKSRSARLEAKGLSEMPYSEFTKWVNHMRRFNAPLIFTLNNWGLGDEDLKESRV